MIKGAFIKEHIDSFQFTFYQTGQEWQWEIKYKKWKSSLSKNEVIEKMTGLKCKKFHITDYHLQPLKLFYKTHSKRLHNIHTSY